MNKIRNAAILLFTAFLWLFATCREQKTDSKITIAAAANTQYVLEAITEEFTASTGIKCDLVTGSSGKLTAQILEGAPYDIFISADLKYPRQIYDNGSAATLPKTYAYGKLVLWSTTEGVSPSMEILSEDMVDHIALANPRTAPYGEAAVSVLNRNQIFDKVEPKLVYGESISQTNQFIISKSAEVGFTAMSVVLSPTMKDKGKWIALDTAHYAPIEQGVILLRSTKAPNNNAVQFYQFLFSENAKQILKNFGYWIDE